ncbi:kinase-like domain-containing protein, partial [Umbelopsis sp. PMI_123]
EQRIQVTDDGEVWYSLIVTGLNDAATIKESILKKMGLKNDPDRYHYFHENGLEPDYSAADRILVKPIKQSTFAYFQEQVWNNFTSHGSEQKHVTTARGENDPTSPVATANAQRPAACSVSFWAVQPPSMKQTSPDSAVKASFDHLSLSEQSQTPPVPKIVTQDLSGSKTTDSAERASPQTPTADPVLLRPTSQPPTDKFWGERPPVELMQKYLDKYFSGHDLDKEIIVESPPVAEAIGQPNTTPNLNRQPLRHKKSIRVVAKEASRRWSHNNNAPAGPMLRRKSTKMWGQRVVEVKPGENTVETPTTERKMGYFAKSVCTKIQWIRGALIGKGSFGRVYHAFNVAAGDFIAVKQVEIPHTNGDLLNPQQKEAVDSLYQEITLLKDLDHEHIVEYLGYDRDESEGVINIFLEYVSGGSISSRLARNGAFEEPVVRYFTRQILLGLEYLHDRNILHRDIKGANILVEGNGICKISDFGLSKKNDYEDPYDQNSHMSLRAALYNLGHYKTPPLPENISDVARDFLEQCFTMYVYI